MKQELAELIKLVKQVAEQSRYMTVGDLTAATAEMRIVDVVAMNSGERGLVVANVTLIENHAVSAGMVPHQGEVSDVLSRLPLNEVLIITEDLEKFQPDMELAAIHNKIVNTR